MQPSWNQRKFAVTVAGATALRVTTASLRAAIEASVNSLARLVRFFGILPTR